MCETIAPDVGTIFKYNNRRYRVQSWLKERSGNKQKAWQYKNCNGKNMLWCARSEATHVSGCGIAGCCAPIFKIKIMGKVPWPKEQIDELRESALRLVGRAVF